MEDLEARRLKIKHDEELAWEITGARVRERILQHKIEERNLHLEERIAYLAKVEMAMLNILEDARELERAIKTERDRVSGILSSMAEALLVIDQDQRVVMVNPIAAGLLGESDMRQIIGRKLGDLIKLRLGARIIEPFEWPSARVFKTGRAARLTLSDNAFMVLSGGKQFPIEITAAPLFSDGSPSAVLVFQDITEQKEFDEAKSNFISIASHQLRTPLVSIRWYAEMLHDGDAGPLNVEQADFAARVYKSALRLIRLINTLLVIAKIESGLVTLDMAKINFLNFTEEILKELDPQLKQKNLRARLQIPIDLPAAELDSLMCHEVIMNLLANAIRYTSLGGMIEVGAKVIEENGKKILYHVKDDGIGIPRAEQDHIFNRFYRASNARAMIGEGSGLGLSLVKSLVESWGGRVWFESPTIFEGHAGTSPGTAFYFTVPVNEMS